MDVILSPIQSRFHKICPEAIMAIKNNYREVMDIFWYFQMVYSLVSYSAWYSCYLLPQLRTVILR